MQTKLLINSTRPIGSFVYAPSGIIGDIIKEETGVVVVEMLRRFGSSAECDDYFVEMLVGKIASTLEMMGLGHRYEIDYSVGVELLHWCLEDTITVVSNTVRVIDWSCPHTVRIADSSRFSQLATLWLLTLSLGGRR